MKGYYKAKDSYKKLNDKESLCNIAPFKHNTLINEGVIYINSFVRVLNKDLSEHLEKVDSPDSKKVESKSSSPSDSWTKEELKEYMVDNGIGFNSGDTKQDLLDKIDASKGEE